MNSEGNLKIQDCNHLKAQVIRRYGTITAFSRKVNRRRSTVYSALKFRRNGPIAEAIRKTASL